ncbi:MAG: hypothetical protein IKI76_09265 [Selenomonadaceae bacterium]|nr:hypothetical protein [Selenomonadaceae bacterium]
MYSYTVKWKVRSNGSSVKDSQHASNVRANSEEEAIEKVKQNNPATRDRMYDFEVRRNY